MSGDAFWKLSLRELWSELLAARRREDARRRDVKLAAWLMAALTRAEKLPALSTFLGQRARPQSLGEQRVVLTMIFGHRGKRVH